MENQQIILIGSGTEKLPVILATEKSEEIILSCNSTLKIEGNYLLVDSLAFAEGYSEKEAVITFSNDTNL